jgi:hypothetical protein
VITVCLVLLRVNRTVDEPVTVKNPRTATSYSVPAPKPVTTQLRAAAVERHERAIVEVPFTYAYTR